MPLYLLSWHREWPAHAVRGVALVRAAHRAGAEGALQTDAGEGAGLTIDEVSAIEDPGTTGVLGYAAQAPAPLRGDRGDRDLAEAAMRDACRALGADDACLEDPLVGLVLEGALARANHAADALQWFTTCYPRTLAGLTPAEAIAAGRVQDVLGVLVRAR